jgi:hypothetical protein
LDTKPFPLISNGRKASASIPTTHEIQYVYHLLILIARTGWMGGENEGTSKHWVGSVPRDGKDGLRGRAFANLNQPGEAGRLLRGWRV